MRPSVWIIDDEQGICASLRFALKSDYNIKTFQSSLPAFESLRKESCDVILLDLKLESEDGLDILREIKNIDSSIAVIMMTAYASIGTSVEAMRAGAYTYLTKPLDLEELRIVIKQALEFRNLNKRVLYLSDELENARHYDRIIGESPAMKRIYEIIDTVKNIDSNVLITGESGTGKELVAKAIHSDGKRAHERFVVVNCAAIPDNLLESEFFGHKKGAFTGATSDRKGKFELADRGTLFLDEIGDMPLTLQSKILRVLQDKEITPVGSSDSRKVDVRFIAATNRNLGELIRNNLFREDLFYRLNVMTIDLPPLRERREDVPLLCDNFITMNCEKMNKCIRGCTSEAMTVLQGYDYPGNVRQLSNIIEYACIVCRTNQIDLADLPDRLLSGSDLSHPAGFEDFETYLSKHSLREIEKAAIIQTLKKNNGRRDKTAADLGISKRGLLNKIHEYKIEV